MKCHIQWVRWHPRGHVVLAGSDDFTVWMWNADQSASMNTFVGHGSSVTCGDFTPDGSIISVQITSLRVLLVLFAKIDLVLFLFHQVKQYAPDLMMLL